MNKTTMTTRSGIAFDLCNPQLEQIKISDIAWALSMQCRFNGHVPQFYSVADHCVRVSFMVPPKCQLTALLHDASETYTGDIISPLKHALKSKYLEIEKNIEQFIASKFGLIYPFPYEVKDADFAMFELEQLWTAGQHAIVTPLSQPEAYITFMKRYYELKE